MREYTLYSAERNVTRNFVVFDNGFVFMFYRSKFERIWVLDFQFKYKNYHDARLLWIDLVRYYGYRKQQNYDSIFNCSEIKVEFLSSAPEFRVKTEEFVDNILSTNVEFINRVFGT